MEAKPSTSKKRFYKCRACKSSTAVITMVYDKNYAKITCINCKSKFRYTIGNKDQPLDVYKRYITDI